MFRDAVVAGQFYPANKEHLLEMLREFTVSDRKPVKAFGVIAPHAGYIYSGRVAGAVYASVEVPDTVILLNPNHTGFGTRAALWERGTWRTPLGDVEVEERLATELKKRAPILQHSVKAHLYEHSGEVHVPFLQYRNQQVRIVPICLSALRQEEIELIASAIAESVAQWEGEVLVVASSDMNHFEDDTTTRQKDRLAIERVLAMDPDGLLETVRMHDISMCGVYPVAVMLKAAKLAGATVVEEIAYDTSASTSGDYQRVVGYFGAIVR